MFFFLYKTDAAMLSKTDLGISCYCCILNHQNPLEMNDRGTPKANVFHTQIRQKTALALINAEYCKVVALIHFYIWGNTLYRI